MLLILPDNRSLGNLKEVINRLLELLTIASLLFAEAI